MRLSKRIPTGREKDEEAVQLLEKLREQLHFSNLTLMRQTAYNLSWLQEDGLDILKEAIFSDSSRKTKVAAAYGLRKMRGRMRKPAIEILHSGAEHENRGISLVCKNAINVLKNKRSHKRRPGLNRRRQRPRFEIKDVSPSSASGNRRSIRPRRHIRHPNRS